MCAFAYRQEEDRAVAAAMRASMAMQRQEEKGAAQERAPPKHRREERTEPHELEEAHSSHRNRNPKPPGEEKSYFCVFFDTNLGY